MKRAADCSSKEMIAQKQMKKLPAGVVAIAEPETQGSLEGVVDVGLRIAEAGAQKRRRMREAILANDAASVLTLACELASFSQREATKRVEEMLASVKYPIAD